MKLNWPLKVIVLMCLLIPLAFSHRTFDQFGTPKITIYYLGIGLLFWAVLFHFPSLLDLPKYLSTAFCLFLLVQVMQTIRLVNIPAGLWGSYGQSESLLVQLGFIVICLASYIFITSESDYHLIKITLLITVFFISIYGIFQYLYGDPITKTIINREKSLFGDPNALGVFLVLTLPLVMMEFKRYFGQWPGYLVAGCLFCGSASLFLTFSRSAWLGFLLSMVPFIYQVWLRFKYNQYHGTHKPLIIVVVLLIMIGGMSGGHFLTHFQTLSHQDYTLPARIASMTQGNDSGRTIIWSTAWQAFKKSPILGYGIGSFQKSFHYFKPAAAIRFWSLERDLKEVHNETLHYLATQGLLGLFSYWLLLLALFYAAGFHQLFTVTLPSEKIAIWSSIIGYLIYMQFNYPLIHYSFLFWIFWGIILRRQTPLSECMEPSKIRTVFNTHPISFLKVVAFLLIGIWSFFCINIFRADLHYRKALDETRFHHYEQSFSHQQKAVFLTPWNFRYRYRYSLGLFRAALWEKKNRRFQLYSIYMNQAHNVLVNLVKNNPDRYEPLFLLGQIKEQQGNFKSASHYYRKALAFYPLNYTIRFRLAKVAWLMGNQREFEAEIKTGSKLAPDYIKGMMLKEGLTVQGIPGI